MHKHRHTQGTRRPEKGGQTESQQSTAGWQERQTRSTHTVYFHLASGKLSQAQQASASNFFFLVAVLLKKWLFQTKFYFTAYRGQKNLH